MKSMSIFWLVTEEMSFCDHVKMPVIFAEDQQLRMLFIYCRQKLH